MPPTVIVFLAGLPVAIAIGLVAARASAPARARLVEVERTATTRFGTGAGLVLFAALAWVAFNVVGTAIGKLAGALEGPIDRPAYRWAVRQYDRSPGLFHERWYHLNNAVTTMGNTLQSRMIVVLASVVLGALWWRRRFWIPPVLIVGTYLAAWSSQHVLTKVVDRGHPPLTFGTLSLGTFPSGGCMRIVSVWGIIAVVSVRTFPRAPRWFGGLLSVGVATAAYVEGYTRATC